MKKKRIAVAAILAVLGVFMFIGGVTSNKGIAYLLLCFLIGAVLIGCAILCVISVVASGKKEVSKIAKVQIVDSNGKLSASRAMARGMVGGFVAGPVGAVVGASTAKTDKEIMFLVTYKDGTKKTKKVLRDSSDFKRYIQFLE